MFNEVEFSAMRFNPFAAGGSMREKYPELSRMKVDDAQVRYIALLYDQGTPLRGRIADIDLRKKEAATIAGIKPVEKIGGEFLDAVVHFLRVSNNRLWTMIVTNEETFYEYATRTMDPVSADDEVRDKDILQAANVKTRLLADMHDIDERLSGYYRRLTGDDDKMADAVRVKRISPESIAKSARDV